MDLAEWFSNESSYAFHHKKRIGEDATTAIWLFEDTKGLNLGRMGWDEINSDYFYCRDVMHFEKYCKLWEKPNKKKTVHIHLVKTIQGWVNITKSFFPHFRLDKTLPITWKYDWKEEEKTLRGVIDFEDDI